MLINVSGMNYKTLNEAVRGGDEDWVLQGCLGQRFIAAGASQGRLTVHGTPGNALGAYLNGAQVIVHGNAQDAVGDTMNDGAIVVHGDLGDTAGCAMRGGAIYMKGNAGYRAGIHMKAYKDKLPVMVIGGRAGSFLGEYQAGGLILVLGLHGDGRPIVGDFPCTGMHGGKLVLRSDCRDVRFPRQVTTRPAGEEDKLEIHPYIDQFCRYFGGSVEQLLASDFTVATPDSNNPYHQLYIEN